MDKSSALKLKPGERIVFGNSMWPSKVRTWQSGSVMHVTPNGGIRVKVDHGPLVWVPYHHVHQGAHAEPLEWIEAPSPTPSAG